MRVDEALALARVFEIPLTQMLLPPGALDNIEALRSLAEGGGYYRQMSSAVGQYAANLQRVARLTADPWYDDTLALQLQVHQDDMDEVAEEAGGHDRVTTGHRRYWHAKDAHTFTTHLQQVRAGADPWEVARSA